MFHQVLCHSNMMTIITLSNESDFSVLSVGKVPDYRPSLSIANLSELIILKNGRLPGLKTLIFLSGITIISYLDD
jgi:hypothetical protein